jgi:hypothetical protein
VSAVGAAEAGDTGAVRPTAVLEALAGLLRAAGGLLAQAAAPEGSAPTTRADGPGAIVGAGPRVAAQAAEYELLVEAIYEGYLVHYGEPRVVRAADPDLALLLGDHLYALGLARLVELGDVEAVCELADVILLSSLAHARGEEPLAAAAWVAGAHAVGWGPSESLRAAKALAAAGAPGAAQALRASAASAA